MTKERRYNEDEVAEIFRTAAASTPATRSAAAENGLTLAELQAVGAEIGIPADRVAASAAALAYPSAAVPRQVSFGMPLSTGRILELPRAPTEREWGLIVTELRAVFAAQGRELSTPTVRRWSNGKLFATIEPTLTGYRMRIGTEKSGAGTMNKLGLTGIILAGATTIGMMLSPGAMVVLALPVMMGGLGVAALVYNAVRLPPWVRQREHQMDHIIERVRTLVQAE